MGRIASTIQWGSRKAKADWQAGIKCKWIAVWTNDPKGVLAITSEEYPSPETKVNHELGHIRLHEVV